MILAVPVASRAVARPAATGASAAVRASLSDILGEIGASCALATVFLSPPTYKDGMTILTRWWRRLPILANESKGPWGSGGNDDGTGGGDRGPPNPWKVPPGAPRGDRKGRL